MQWGVVHLIGQLDQMPDRICIFVKNQRSDKQLQHVDGIHIAKRTRSIKAVQVKSSLNLQICEAVCHGE
jgi:hypothetical protein